MALAPVYRLEVEVIEGRGFPRPVGHQVVAVQASLGHKLLRAESSHRGRGTRANDPIWRGEGERGGVVLAWELTTRGLDRIRSRYPHLKLHLDALPYPGADPSRSPDATKLGWVMVDLRHVQTALSRGIPADVGYHPIRGSALTSGAELRIAARIEPINSPSSPVHPAETHHATTSVPPSDDSIVRGEEMGVLESGDGRSGGGGGGEVVREVEERESGRGEVEEQRESVPPSLQGAPALPAMTRAGGDAVLVGGSGDDAPAYLLTVEIFGLNRLLPSMGKKRGRFWLSYAAFGVVVQSDVFENTATPHVGFRTLRDSFRIRAMASDLIDFLHSTPPLQVYLCSQNVAWSVATLPLHALLPPSTSSTHSSSPPTTLSGDITNTFPLVPLHPRSSYESYQRTGSPQPGLLHASVSIRPENKDVGGDGKDEGVVGREEGGGEGSGEGSGSGVSSTSTSHPSSHTSRLPLEVAAAADEADAALQRLLQAQGGRGSDESSGGGEEDGEGEGEGEEEGESETSGSEGKDDDEEEGEGGGVGGKKKGAAVVITIHNHGGTSVAGGWGQEVSAHATSGAAGSLAHPYTAAPPSMPRPLSSPSGKFVVVHALDLNGRTIRLLGGELGVGERVVAEGLVLEVTPMTSEQGGVLGGARVSGAFEVKHSSAGGGEDDVVVGLKAACELEFPFERMPADWDQVGVRVRVLQPSLSLPSSTDSGDEEEETLVALAYLQAHHLSPSPSSPIHLLLNPDLLPTSSSSSSSSSSAPIAGIVSLSRSTKRSTAPTSRTATAPLRTQHPLSTVSSTPETSFSESEDDKHSDWARDEERERERVRGRERVERGEEVEEEEGGGAAEAEVPFGESFRGATSGVEGREPQPTQPSPHHIRTPSLPPPAWSESEGLRHWRLAVEVRGVRRLAKPGAVFAKTSVLELGPTSVLKTSPPLLVPRHAERALPGAFKAFSFVAGGSDMAEWAKKRELEVELWKSERFRPDERLGLARFPLSTVLSVATAIRCPHSHRTFPTMLDFKHHLSSLKSSLPRGTADYSTPPVEVRAADAWLPVLHGDGGEQGEGGSGGGGEDWVGRAADLRIVVYLEDFGPIVGEEREARRNGAARGKAAIPPIASIAPPSAKQPQPAPIVTLVPAATALFGWEEGREERRIAGSGRSGSGSGRGGSGGGGSGGGGLLSMEERVEAAVAEAVEEAESAFARWREAEEASFAAGLRAREEDARRRLEEEFGVKERERAAEVAASAAEVDALERRLRRAIVAAEKQARDAQAAKEQAEREGREAVREAAAELRRAREDAEQRTRLAEREAVVAKEELERERKRRIEAEEKMHRATERASVAAAQAAASDAGGVTAAEAVKQVPVLTKELAEARADAMAARSLAERESKRAEEESKQADTARAQALRLAREVHRLRSALQKQAKTELEKLRVEYLAREERFALEGDRAALRQIKQRIQAMASGAEMHQVPRERVSRSQSPPEPESAAPAAPTPAHPPSPPASPSTPPPPPSIPPASEQAEELAALRQQRRALLEQGGLSESDPVVTDLDALIAVLGN